MFGLFFFVVLYILIGRRWAKGRVGGASCTDGISGGLQEGWEVIVGETFQRYIISGVTGLREVAEGGEDI